MISLAIVILTLLTVASIIDFYVKKIPSILLTAMIFIIAMVNMTEITFGLIHMSFGILAFIFAWLIYEGRFIGGIADVKVISMIGMMVKNIPVFFIMIGLIMILGVSYKLIWRYGLKRKKQEEVPFLPCLWLVYLILFFMGGII